MCVQVDDGYPSDRIMLQEDIAVILFHNDTRLVKEPDEMDIYGVRSGRAKLGATTYAFSGKQATPNVSIGDLFVVSSFPLTFHAFAGLKC
jgi:hypothetical protein